MRIAYLVGEFPSLSETFILNQIIGLLEKNCQVDIYGYEPSRTAKLHPDVTNYNLLNHTFYYKNLPKNYFIRLITAFWLFLINFYRAPLLLLRSLDFNQFGHQALSFRLFYAVIPFIGNNKEYDVIHCHFGHNGLLGMNLRHIGALQGPLVTTFHARDITQKLSELGEDAYDALFLESQFLLPISEHWQKKLQKLGCDPSKILVHHMGIDCQKFTFIPRKYDGQGKVEIVSIARLVQKKGIEYGIRAIAHLKKQGYSVRYSVIGNGELYDELNQLISELNLTDSIYLLGWKHQDELLEILNSAHILLAPSVTSSQGDQEGIPVALMEALAMGLPVVSTQHSGIPELVDDGISGYLVPEYDAEALAEKLACLIDEPQGWAEMGEAGRHRVEKDFNIDKLNTALFDVFRSI